jgi:Protein of unknown function (DUF1524)
MTPVNLQTQPRNATVCSNEKAARSSRGQKNFTTITVVLAFALAACTPQQPAKPTDVIDAAAALTQLETLPVKGRAPKTGYTRAQFGPAWKDVDRNGCDTRNDILRRDLTTTTGTGCRVLTGTLTDPYTGARITFVRGPNSADVQIDHIVALGNAWVTGAQQLTDTQREQFANDPLNLMAVDGPTNGAKSDGDAATWLPPRKPHRCAYVSRQVAVKARYRLWVTAAEKTAIKKVLNSCPNASAPPLDAHA